MDGITLRNCKPEISTDGTNWTDIGGDFNSVDISGGEVETGETYVASQSLPVIGIGKKKMTTAKIKVLYGEGLSSAWRKFWDAYSNGSDIYFRYSPKGGHSGDQRFVSDKGFVTSPVYPNGEVGDAKPITTELTFTCGGFTPETIA